jgi:hypothetical protein
MSIPARMDNPNVKVCNVLVKVFRRVGTALTPSSIVNHVIKNRKSKKHQKSKVNDIALTLHQNHSHTHNAPSALWAFRRPRRLFSLPVISG